MIGLGNGDYRRGPVRAPQPAPGRCDCDGVAKLKPEYLPMGAQRYHSRAPAMFAVDHYKETGRILAQGRSESDCVEAEERLQNSAAEARITSVDAPTEQPGSAGRSALITDACALG
jgi:hypothetical protein